MAVKRILFVWTSAEFSTYDVARGYRAALEKTGRFNIRDYRLHARMKHHARGFGEERAQNLNLLTRVASENIVVEAIRHNADLVLIISGMGLHPDGVWMLRKAGFRTAVIFTESPYNDREQREFHGVYPEMQCFTMERTSATRGWKYLPCAYDPEVHRRCEDTHQNLDVFLVGTMWKERIELFERVDWTGLRVKFKGAWVAPPTPEESSIGQFFDPALTTNLQAPKLYSAARICLNMFRAHPNAESLNPRVYEVTACKSFLLTDERAELRDVFNGSVATFTLDNLGEQIRYWLEKPAERVDMIEAAYEAVKPHTFDARVETLLSSL